MHDAMRKHILQSNAFDIPNTALTKPVKETHVEVTFNPVNNKRKVYKVIKPFLLLKK